MESAFGRLFGCFGGRTLVKAVVDGDALALAEAGEGAERRDLPAERARADAVRPAMRHEGAHVGGRQRGNVRERWRRREMAGQEAEELLEIALVGLERILREPPLAAEIAPPSRAPPAEGRRGDDEKMFV